MPVWSRSRRQMMGALFMVGQRDPSSADIPRTSGFWLAAAAILFLALNLRIPTTALGPLVPVIQADTGHGETFLSLLTSIPLALTLLVAPFAPRLATRWGRDRVLGLVLIGVIVGTVIRSIPGDPTLLAGTALLGCAIAVGTVLTPAAIAAEQPRRRGALTGVFTLALSLGPALAVGLTIPLMRGTGASWRETLAMWSMCGALAIILWIAYTRSSRSSRELTASSMAIPGSVTAMASPGSTIKDPNVWILAIYLGVTSLTFYTVSAWLPSTFKLDGLTTDAAGGYAALVNVIALPFAFLAPIAMRRGWSRVLSPLSPLIAAAGVALLLVAGSGAALPIAVLLGVAQGLCLGVSYDQIVQYATSPAHAASVSALTSTVGIAIAAVGPLAFGFGLESSGSYQIPASALGVVILVQATVGLRSGRFARSRT